MVAGLPVTVKSNGQQIRCETERLMPDRITELVEQIYDISGREIDGAYKELHMGLTLEELRGSGNVICVADTPGKAEAVFGALRGRMINTLITTLPLARQLLEVAKSHSL